MKLLLDENLSFRLIELLARDFPDSRHVDTVGLHSQSDATIANSPATMTSSLFRRTMTFVSSRCFRGAPPKVIWLSVGNSGTEAILRLLIDGLPKIEAFIAVREESLLVLAEQR